tara:strand:+ start:2663 stop:11581 length:8919 start_codon:yes stop_codon:yes gene_type:complete
MSKRPIDQLYANVKADGRFTGGYEDFVGAMKDESYRDKVFDSVSKSGEYSYNQDSFHIRYRPESSEFMQDGDAIIFNNDKEYTERDIIATAGGTNEQVTGMGQDPNTIMDKLKPVTADLIDMDEENVVKHLRQSYSGMGFEFEEGGLGDYVYVTHPDAKEPLKISTDNFELKLGGKKLLNGNQKNADKLNEFFNTYGNPDAMAIKNSHALPQQLSVINDLISEEAREGGGIVDYDAENASSNRLSKEAHNANAAKDIEGGYIARFGRFIEEKGSVMKYMPGVGAGSFGFEQDLRNKARKVVGTVGEVLGKAINANSNKHLENAEDYFEDLQRLAPERFKELVPEGEVTPELIKEKAIQLRSNELQENEKIERVNSHLANLSSEEEDYLMKVSAKQTERMGARVKDNKIKINRVLTLEKAVVQESNDLNKLIEQINARAEGGEVISRKEIQDFKLREQKLRNTYNLVNKAKLSHIDLNNNFEAQKESLDYLENINNATANAIYTFGVNGTKVFSNALWLGGTITDHLGTALENAGDNRENKGKGKNQINNSNVSALKVITYGLRETAKSIDKRDMDRFLKKQPVGFSGVKSTVEKGILGVFENLPNLALAYVTGGGSMVANMAVFGLSGGVDKHKEMVGDVESGKRKYTTDQLIMAPIAYGGFEAATMIPEMLMLRGALKGPGTGVFGEVRDELFKPILAPIGRSLLGFAKAQASEISQEVFTQLGQNGVDRFMLDKRDERGDRVELGDGLDADFFIKTIGSTGAFHVGPRALQGALGLMTGMTTEADNVEMNKRSAKMVDLSAKIKIVTDQLLGDEFSAVNNSVGRGKKEAELNELQLELSKEELASETQISSIMARFGGLNQRGVNLLRGLARESGSLRDQAREIKQNPDLSRREKRQKLKMLSDRFDNVEAQKEQLINHDKSYQLEDGKKVKDLEQRALAILNDKNKTAPTQQQVEKQAQKMWDEENKSSDSSYTQARQGVADQIKRFESDVMIGKINEIDPEAPIEKFEGNTLQEAKDWLTNNLKEKGFTKKEIGGLVKELEDTWEDATASILQPKVKNKGVNKKTNKFDKHQLIIVNAKKSAKNKNFAARGHEILHAIVWKAFKASGVGFKTMAQGMESLIKSQDEVGAKWLKQRMKAYVNKSGKLDNDYYEEVIMAIADGIRAGRIKNDGDTQAAVQSSLMKAIRKVFPGQEDAGSLLINNPQDMLNLISKYSSSLKKGELDLDIQKLVAGDVVVSEDLKIVEQKTANRKFKKSMDALSKSAREVLTEAIQESRKISAEKVNDVYGKFKNGNVESFDALNDIGLAYDAMFNKAIKQFEDEHNVRFGQEQIDQFKFEAIYGDRGIRGALIFDPKKPRKIFDPSVQVIIDGVLKDNVPAKYLNGLLPQRMIEFAVKAIPNLDEYYAKDISNMIDLEAEETADVIADNTQEYKRDKKDLTDLSVVKKEAIKAINDDVKSIVKRALANPVQSAQETINAIEQKIEKEYFKLIKKEMGGIHQYGKSKIVVISEEYKAFHDLQHDIIVKGLPAQTIKRKYNTLFDLVKLGRELTPQGNAIYDIKLSKPKAEFINFFIKGKYTTLKNKQASLAKEVAQALASKAAYEILKDQDVLNQIAEMQDLQGFTSLIGIENEIKEIGDNLDKKKGEERKFDNIKLSKDIAELSADEKQIIYKGLPKLGKVFIAKGSFDSAFENAFPEPLFGKYRKNIKKDIINYMKTYNVEKEKFVKVGKKPEKSLVETIRDEVAMQENKTTLEAQLGLTKGDIDTKDLTKLDNVYKAVVKIAEKLGPAKARRFLYFLHSTGKVGGTSAIRNLETGKLEFDPEFFPKRIKKVYELLQATPKEDVKKIAKLEKQILGYQEQLEAGKEPTKHPYGILKNSAELDAIVKDITGESENIPSNIAQNVTKVEKSDWTYETDLESAERNRAILIELSDIMMELRDAPDGITSLDIGYILMSLNADMGTPLAAAANVRYIQDDGLKKTASAHRYEHLTPRKVIQMIMAGYISGEISKADFQTALDDFHVAIIDKTQDDIVGKYYKSSLPAGIINVLDRYFNMKTFGEIDLVLIDTKTNKPVPKSQYYSKAAKELDIKTIKQSKDIQQVINNAPQNKDAKGISVFDFDETAGISENVVIARRGDVTVEISSADWPSMGESMINEGFKMDFTDFNKVTNGRPGPLMQKLKNQIKKYGRKDVFILTARAPQSQKALHDYLLSEGVDIPIENITGLGNSTAEAKADWFIDKLAEGYNDFYFVDDALPNVKAVDNLLSQFDVKSKSVQAIIKNSMDMDLEINDIIEQNKGIQSEKRYKRSQAKIQGRKQGRWKLYIPPGAEDFMGLMYNIASAAGKLGEAQLDFFRDNILKPYQEGINNLNKARQAVTTEYKDLLKAFPNVKAKLNEMVPGTNFTYDAAVRVYLWDKAGFKIPETSQAAQKQLVDAIKADAEMLAFAESVGLISRRPEGYVKPEEDWIAETIVADLDNAVNKIARKEFLAQFQENVGVIFSQENLNKIEAAYGLDFREALEDMLHRMTTGKNKNVGKTDRQVNRWTEWISNSIGAIMFLNMRSALLQTLSTINFINWSDNNPVKAAAAFANQKNYWATFSKIFNSDFLKQRRSGLKMDVNEAALANAMAGKTNKAKAALAYILKLGFTPTQIADSFAIAAGGATFLINRTNTYLKKGMNRADAEAQAFEDFTSRANESQQSSDPSLISKQQASILGRFILAFQNTPMQYARLMKKAGVDLIKGRGDWKTNVSRIVYYGAVQNIIFASLQSALFALAFAGDDEDEELKDKKIERLGNTVVDSLLRGTGIYGAVLATAKNIMLEFWKQDQKGYRADHAYTLLAFANISPPIGSKMRKLYSATQTRKFNKEIMDTMGVDINNPMLPAVSTGIEAFTNIPLGRIVTKVNNAQAALNEENAMWQRMALIMGWNTWDVGVKNLEVEEARRVNKIKKKRISAAKRKSKSKSKPKRSYDR